MKQLTIVRHAKSSWSEPGLSDFDRPLNRRGERDAPEMGRRLAERGSEPDLIVSSSAARARATAEVLARAIGHDPAAVELREDLYLASVDQLLRVLRSLPETRDHVLLVAHNPGLTALVNLLSGIDLENLPTCGVAELDLELDSWSQLRPGAAVRARLDFPKRPLA
jgi:phosphohistidine phosphatase